MENVEEKFRELKENAHNAETMLEAAEASEQSINNRIEELATSTKDAIDVDQVDVVGICKAVEVLKSLHIASYEAAQETGAAQRLYNLVYPKWEDEVYKRRLEEKGKRIKPNWDGDGDEWESIDTGITGDGRKYKSKRKKKTKSKRKKKTKKSNSKSSTRHKKNKY